MRPAIQIQTRRKRTAGFTLVEMWVALTIFSLITIAIISVQLFALRIYTFAATKLTATAAGRHAVDLIREQVRSAKVVNIGTYTNSIFSIIGDNTNQVGSALYVCPTSDQTFGTIFYKDQVNNNLVSVSITNGTISTNGLTITGTGHMSGYLTNAMYITNYYVFDAETFQGTILTNNNNSRTIHMVLMFSQWEYPVAGVASGALYDYYQLHTRMTRRAFQ
jgi:prepilin-type N-terminal cleavage/methylation domain-containing protein